MPRSASLQPADAVTVNVIGPDGVLIDVIEDVDLGDPVEASRNGRTSLKEAALWAALATDRYRRLRSVGARLDGTPNQR